MLDRQSGGKLGWLYDLFNGRDDWFALYAIDENIDDEFEIPGKSISAWAKLVVR